MSEEKCGNCKFYHIENQTTFELIDDEKIHPEDYESECRRYPPIRGDIEYFGSMKNPRLRRDFFSGPFVQVTGWCGEWKIRQIQEITGESDGLMSMKITDIGLSYRTIACLENEGILSVNTLITWTQNQLLKTPNLGKKSLLEIVEALDRLNLRLGSGVVSRKKDVEAT